MGIRKCIVKECPSRSARVEDRGVTYHKIPAREEVKKKWMVACRLADNYVINKGSNVCSLHFRKADFQDFKGTKYVLKTGVVPSIFPWANATTSGKKDDEAESKDEKVKPEKAEDVKPKKEEDAKRGKDEDVKPEKNEDAKPEKSEDQKPEKVEDVKEENKADEKPKELELLKQPECKTPDPEDKKPEEQKPVKIKKEAKDAEEMKHEVTDDDIVLKDEELLAPMLTPKQKTPTSKKRATPKRPASTRASTTSAKKKRKSEPVPVTTPKEKKSAPSPRRSTSAIASSSQSQINFTSGTKIEAQDFSGKWHPAKLVEVDTEEREVLVQFERGVGKSKSSLNDEWIPMDSVRLRPIQLQKTPNGKLKFAIGEKCFARWSDSRKFRATIQNILENDMYEVLFDDGFVKVCKAGHISKLKKSELNQETDILITPIKQEDGATSADPPVTPVTPITPITAIQIPQIAKVSDFPEIPQNGEWCCHWMNDFPVGEEATVEVGGVKIYSVIVHDWRLPEGWVKHLYQRITVYGKMDVLLVNPDGKVFRNRQELKAFYSQKGGSFDLNTFDFGLHKKRAKDLGFCHYTKEYTDSLLPLSIAAEPVLLNTEVNIGSVKVKIIDNLYQCPEQDCLKTFRKENHLQIHIKHYHKELAKGLGEILNMQDLAALRTPVEIIDTPPKVNRRKSTSAAALKSLLKEEAKKDEIVIKKEPGLEEEEKNAEMDKDVDPPEPDNSKEKLDEDDKPLVSATPVSAEAESPKPEASTTPVISETVRSFDLEEAIETHAVTKPSKKGTKIKLFARKKKTAKKTKAGFITKKAAPTATKKRRKKLNLSRSSMDYLDAEETRHSFAASGNDSFFRHSYGYDKDADASQTTNASICGQYGDDSINAAVSSPRFISENGEVIKIVSMRKEEIINCLCGYGEEDGLMVQCELCLCWQHGICNGFERDNQVPDKYICYICRNPQGGRESRRYIHDQDWLYEGKLPVANYHVPNSKHAARFDILKQSHTLGGNLLELKRFMHSLKVKINIAEKKDHPKMYLWSKKWEKSPPRGGNGDLSGIVALNSSLTSAGAPTAAAQGMANSASGRHDSPGQKPIPIPHIPVPEAPIDPAECQAILLEHIQKQQNAAMARLQAIEAQIIALEAYDDKPELLESPTAKNYPKTKQTIHMLLNDLVKLKKIAAIHRSAQQPPPY